MPPVPARAEGEPVILFNGKDPGRIRNRVFKVEERLIHISGQEFGALTTEKEFENYRLTVKFRWGTKKWPPREKAARDSGILVRCDGPDKVWTQSIECQIQEHDCGDFWLVDGTSVLVDGEPAAKRRIAKKADGEKMTFPTVPGRGLGPAGQSVIGPCHGSVVVDHEGIIPSSSHAGVSASSPVGTVVRKFLLCSNPDLSKRGNYKVPQEEWIEGIFSGMHDSSRDKDGILYVQD
jgi:hypothetical protein